MTFSLAARDEKTGEFGCIVSSSSICVTSRCAFVSPYGAVMSQNVTQPGLGITALALLSEGLSAKEALQQIVEQEPYPEYRQLSIVDTVGNIAGHDGQKALGTVSRSWGNGCVSAGNMLATPDVTQAMVDAFIETEGAMAHRLVSALEAGLRLGGEAGPLHSAGVKVARPGYEWPIVDLRVDWSDTPVETLRSLWKQYQVEMEDYITRADNPEAAPSYGVPGDE